MDQAVKRLLPESLGLEKPPPTDDREQFLDLFGRWSAKEAEAFEARARDLDTIEPDEWENGTGP